MSFNLPKPITYLITAGATTEQTLIHNEECARLLAHVSRAVEAGVSLVQLREKNLTARSLYELAVRAAEITRSSTTRLLVGDRADIARASGADGVHLTTRSLDASVVRHTFGKDFLIGVSTHSHIEAQTARDGGADFATFGPVFDTPSKREYGAPVGLDSLREAAHALEGFPLIALGGISLQNMNEALQAGASGIAAIRLFEDADNCREAVRRLKDTNKAHSSKQ